MTDPILTPDGPVDASPLQPSSRRICHVCQKQFSEYTCPRCNSRYCSLQCYKSHSLRCTESFMRENVVGELQNVQPNDDSKRRMLEILKRFHSEDEEDNMDEDDSLSEETIQKILSGSEIGLDDLSIEEKKRFERAVASGELSKMIEPWEPWWTNPSARTIRLSPDGTQQQLIHPLDDDEEGTSSGTEIPHGPETPLLPISKLSSTEPSPLLAFHLVDILYSYCFTLRLYNGDWQSDPIGSTMAVFSVSSVLGQGVQPQSLLEGMSHGMEQTCSPSYRHVGGLQFAMALIDDVITVLSLGSTGVIISLCELQRLLKAGEQELKSEKKMMKSKREEIKRKLKLADRKVYFIMCWVHEQPAEAWSSLASLMKAEKDKSMVHVVQQRKTQPNVIDRTKGKKMIEEIQ